MYAARSVEFIILLILSKSFYVDQVMIGKDDFSSFDKANRLNIRLFSEESN